jgi:hypothetical protein
MEYVEPGNIQFLNGEHEREHERGTGKKFIKRRDYHENKN